MLTRPRVIVNAYHTHRADRVYAESNFGGDMVESTIRTVDATIAFMNVTASRGKAIRAEPISALYEQGKIHHIGPMDSLENEMVSWLPNISSWSPNRMDALVWVLTELMLGSGGLEAACVGIDPPERLSPRIHGLRAFERDEPWPFERRPSIWDDDNYGRGLFTGG